MSVHRVAQVRLVIVHLVSQPHRPAFGAVSRIAFQIDQRHRLERIDFNRVGRGFAIKGTEIDVYQLVLGHFG